MALASSLGKEGLVAFNVRDFFYSLFLAWCMPLYMTDKRGTVHRLPSIN
jgi:hypothetical protein